MEVNFPEPDDSMRPLSAISEEVGKDLFWASLIIAGVPFCAAALKKNRVYVKYTPQFTQSEPAPVTVSETVEIPRAILCTEDERATITELFTGIADIPYSSLANFFNGHAKRLNDLGNKIRHVHPFALLIAMPKEKIRTIFASRDGFKIGRVLAGIGEGIKRESGMEDNIRVRRDNVQELIPAFAHQIGGDKTPEQIKQWIQTADWQSLVRYLYDIPP